ncbi:unnamed protein product [Linum tenue]|uniref:Uncharacterized protein n=1 Tax=Linum tenue TaxID=586396 RepID=A0AAV0R1Z1_9ROSI|nr:unnamed protein product [Linum tenue]CAI0551181.1 unnamed protein product [Linum tenue]
MVTILTSRNSELGSIQTSLG